MKTIIKEIGTITTQGVSFKLTEKASLDGGLRTVDWSVSWDKIGKALFKEQYTDAESVKDLNDGRGILRNNT